MKQKRGIALGVDAQTQASPFDRMPFSGEEVLHRDDRPTLTIDIDLKIAERKPEFVNVPRQRDRHRHGVAAVDRRLDEAGDIGIVDANEAWTDANLEFFLGACTDAGVTLVEQPLPASHDAALSRVRRPIAVCADESVHDRASLTGLRDRYDAINIKLDKTGGLTEALAMSETARALGFDIMVGCMVATSLAMAPAMLVAQQARVVDLDGPLLLKKDRDGGLRYEGSTIYPPDASLWG